MEGGEILTPIPDRNKKTVDLQLSSLELKFQYDLEASCLLNPESPPLPAAPPACPLKELRSFGSSAEKPARNWLPVARGRRLTCHGIKWDRERLQPSLSCSLQLDESVVLRPVSGEYFPIIYPLLFLCSHLQQLEDKSWWHP